MDSKIYSYALVKSLKDTGEDFLDSFLPIIIQLITEDPIATYSISKKLREEYKIEIPLHSLELILNRAQKKDYITSNKHERYKLTEKGSDYKNSLEPKTTVERRINALILDIKEYFERFKLPQDEDKILKILEKFIESNIEPLMLYFDDFGNRRDIKLTNETTIENILIEYIKEACKGKPEHYSTLKDMILGSIILITVQSKKYDQINKDRDKKFKTCQIFLDTNIVFSLLNCHSSEQFEASKEFLNLVQKTGCKIYVFKFTMDETVKYLQGYYKKRSREDDLYRGDIYSKLAQLRWKKTDIQKLISKIPLKLQKLGIDIKEIENFDLNSYEPKDPQVIEKIRAYKPNDSRYTLKHDIAAIEKITEIRNKPIYHIEDTKAIFLTADRALYDFNYNGMQHQDDGTIGEVILDRLLTTIIWLKDPDLDIPLSAIISAHSRGIFTKWSIWDKFFSEVEMLRESGELTEDEILMLHYNNYIDEELKIYRENETEKITPDKIREYAEKAKKIYEEEKQISEDRIRREAENEIIASKQIYQKENEERDTRVQNKCKATARTLFTFFQLIVVGLIVIIVASIIYLIGFEYIQTTILTIAGTLTILSCIFGPIHSFKEKTQDKWANRIYSMWKSLMD